MSLLKNPLILGVRQQSVKSAGNANCGEGVKDEVYQTDTDPFAQNR
jgi:hypothetical protein